MNVIRPHPVHPSPAGSPTPPSWRRRRPATRERGLAFIVAIVVVLAIASMLLVFARRMQTEALASANHAAQVRARLIAEGVARALVTDLAQPEAGDIEPSISNLELDGDTFGDGLYWVLRVNYEDERQHAYGLFPEAAKLNINTTSHEVLRLLPGMNGQIAAAIVDWRDGDLTPTDNGAESEYYLARRPAYNVKNAPFETLDELRLVRDVDRQLLDGEDWNRNGVLDPGENDGNRTPPPDNGDGRLERGLRHYVTVYSSEPNISITTGERRINVSDADEDAIEEALTAAGIGEERAGTLADRIDDGEPFQNMIELIAEVDPEPEEEAPIIDRLTTEEAELIRGLVDATAAPAEVFDALPELEPGDGEALVDARQSASNPGRSWRWVIEALGEEKAVEVGDRLTLRSFQFSADIIAVTGDCRGFHRLHVIIDAAEDPPRIIYARDLTHLGWPLESGIREDLRNGVAAEDVALRYGQGAGL